MIFLLICLLFGTLIKNINIKPYSFLLILLGILLGIIYDYSNTNEYTNSIDFWINMHPHTFLFIFLPPLIYESSFLIDFHIFKKIYKIIISSAIAGVIATFVSISGYFYFVDNDFDNKYCLIIGSILSATDPIAVIAILTELKISHKLSTLIEGESLLNDGITIIVFNVVLDYILKEPSITNTIGNIFRLLFGGLIIGSVLTTIKIYWLKKTFNDIISESLITIGTCYLIYYISEFTKLHTSGILALVISGLFMAYYGKTRISPNNQKTIKDIWFLFSSVSNMIIFTLSGVIISTQIYFKQLSYENWFILGGLFFIVNLIRLGACAIIYPCIKSHQYKYDNIDFFIFSLSGLRGEISLALALSINLENKIPSDIRNLILFYTSGVVFFSIFINSHLIKFLINKFQKNKININNENLNIINHSINKHTETYLQELKNSDFHLEKADFNFITNNLISHIDNSEIIVETYEKDISQKIFYIKTLKSVIWNLYKENYIHYSIVLKLIEITDNSLDDINEEWGEYINDFCNKKNHNTWEIKMFTFLETNFCSYFSIIKKYILYHKVEHDYNLLLGYILSQKKTYEKIKELVENEQDLQYINLMIEKSLILPTKYIENLENNYSEILIEIENKNLSLLIISYQKKYLDYLFKNGEIDEKIHDILFNKLDNKEYNLHQLLFLREHNL